MSISVKIDEIIARRKGTGSFAGQGMVDKVREKKAYYQSLLEALNDYQTKRAVVMKNIQEKSGVYYSLTVSDPNFEDNITNASAESAINKVHVALRELDSLEKRFDRDTVNISAIGRARQGKSRLLQSITGVGNAIIPADSGTDCTGAKSVVCNEKCETYAIIRFYTEAELVSNVQKYLDKLQYNYSIGSVARIKDIPMTDIESLELSSSLDSYRDWLSKYVNNWSVYTQNLGREIKVGKDDIRKYVAQYLEDGTKVYDYLSVKEVEIHTPFEYEDAGKIMLVDTIGLGDTAIGLEDKMVDTLINDSDAAILLRRPEKLGDGIREEDNALYDMLDKKMAGRDLSKWLFYVLNTYVENKRNSDEFLVKLNAKREKHALKAAFVKQIDCASKDAVEQELIIPVLQSLSENLISIDNGLMKLANQKLEDVYNEVYELNEKLANLVNNGLLQSIEGGDLFDVLFEDKLELGASLRKLNRKFIDRNKRHEELELAIKDVLKNIKNYLPTEEELEKALFNGGKIEHLDVVYNSYADELRSKIRDEFDNVCGNIIVQLQEGILTEVIDEFYEAGLMKNIPLMGNVGDNKIEWFKCLTEEKTIEGSFLRASFDEILNYRLHIEGLMKFKVHCALDCLQEMMVEDAPEGQLPRLRDEVQSKSTTDQAKEIRQTLAGLIPRFANDLIDSIAELLIIPNNSFNALIRKVRDRLFYQKEGNRRLKEFYRANCISIWHDEFAQISQQNEASSTLNGITSSLKGYTNKSAYLL